QYCRRQTHIQHAYGDTIAPADCHQLGHVIAKTGTALTVGSDTTFTAHLAAHTSAIYIGSATPYAFLAVRSDNTILIRFWKGIGCVRRNLFWLSDEQWKRIEPRLPTDVRGVERVDDRRVISGIVHVLKSGCRWCDCPPEYGPPTTIYNRFVRW